jgi:hypothetical protein
MRQTSSRTMGCIFLVSPITENVTAMELGMSRLRSQAGELQRGRFSTSSPCAENLGSPVLAAWPEQARLIAVPGLDALGWDQSTAPAHHRQPDCCLGWSEGVSRRARAIIWIHGLQREATGAAFGNRRALGAHPLRKADSVFILGVIFLNLQRTTKGYQRHPFAASSSFSGRVASHSCLPDKSESK